MNEELEKLWNWCNLSQARAEATTAMVQAITPLVKDNARFPVMLKAVFDARMADRLNRNITDGFIEAFQSELMAMTPDEHKHLLR